MGAGPGEGRLTAPRFFLVAPEGIGAGRLAECLDAALEAGDVASLLVPAESAAHVLSKAQARGVAVLVPAGRAALPDFAFDGIQADAAKGDIAGLRRALGETRILGAYCGTSRHAAMEAAEAGADYIAFAQTGHSFGEPIIGWWTSLFEIPAVAFDPVDPEQLDILLPQKPDFIRPSDAMWDSAASASSVIAGLNARIAG